MANTQPPRKSTNAMFVPAKNAKNTNAACQQSTRANANSSSETKWMLLQASSTDRACTDPPKRKWTRWDCSEMERSIFVPVHGALRLEQWEHSTPSCSRNTTASHPFCPTKTQHGATPHYSSRHAEPSLLKSNTSHTMNSCQSFWDNKSSTKKV